MNRQSSTSSLASLGSSKSSGDLYRNASIGDVNHFLRTHPNAVESYKDEMQAIFSSYIETYENPGSASTQGAASQDADDLSCMTYLIRQERMKMDVTSLYLVLKV
jgi:hypothetical protein